MLSGWTISYTCHSLRHTAAILSLKAGASIYDVQQMLGHTSIKPRIYLRAIDAEKRMDNAAIRRLDELF
ncbi:MAG: tyrosine-type recombinase/integrase [Butyricimonas faecalis]